MLRRGNGLRPPRISLGVLLVGVDDLAAALLAGHPRVVLGGDVPRRRAELAAAPAAEARALAPLAVLGAAAVVALLDGAAAGSADAGDGQLREVAVARVGAGRAVLGGRRRAGADQRRGRRGGELIGEQPLAGDGHSVSLAP